MTCLLGGRWFRLQHGMVRRVVARSFDEGTFFGHSTSHLTMIRNTIPFRDARLGDTQAYTDKCRKAIKEGHDDFIVMAMDNNQRGQR